MGSQLLIKVSFRAECMRDVEVLGDYCRRRVLRYVMDVNQDDTYPDVEVEMTTYATLQQIEEGMRTVSDGHVMWETLRACPLAENSLVRGYGKILPTNGVRMDYIDLEKTTNRVTSALKAVTDTETSKKLDSVNYILAELRHAAVSLDDGAPVDQVSARLMQSLFSDQLNADKKPATPKL